MNTTKLQNLEIVQDEKEQASIKPTEDYLKRNNITLYLNASTDADIEHKFSFNEMREVFKTSMMNVISFFKM